MSKHFANLWAAHRFLAAHRKRGFDNTGFLDALYINRAMVNPLTGEIDDDPDKNTRLEVWLESGPGRDESGAYWHDIDLDCGASTIEEAMMTLAEKVLAKWGPGGPDDPIPDRSPSDSLGEEDLNTTPGRVFDSAQEFLDYLDTIGSASDPAPAPPPSRAITV